MSRGGGCFTLALVLSVVMGSATVVGPGPTLAEASRPVSASGESMGPTAAASSDPVALFTARHDRMRVDFDARASYSPVGAVITFYLWDFGDGQQGEGPLATHTYTTPGRYAVTLTVEDAQLRRASTVRYVSPADTTVDILMDRFFEAGCPYEPYWEWRYIVYGDQLLSNQVPCVNYTPWVLFSSSLELQRVNPSFLNTLYRYDARVRNHPGYNLSDPIILPVLEPQVAPGPTSFLQFNLTFNYLDAALIEDLSRTPFAVNEKFSDGYGYLLSGTVSADLTMARRLFGVQGATPSDARAWWQANTGAPRQPGPLENRVAQWLEALGNGKYDIYNGFEWFYETDITWLNGTVASDGTTTVQVFWNGFGLDVLMARWWYWGNASYRDAVCAAGVDPNCRATLPYGAIQPQGWMPMELCWCESATIRGTIRQSLDLDFQAVQTYHFMAWANWGGDGSPGTADDLPAWVFAPMLIDYVPRVGSGSVGTSGYPNSELRWYEGLTTVHGTPGSYAYGQTYEYMNVPTRWNLGPGSTLTLTLPEFEVPWYDPVRSTWDPVAKIGRYVTTSAPLTLRQVCTSMDSASCSPASEGTFYTWDPKGKVISFAGPHDWGSQALPLRAAPWVEFGPEIAVLPQASFEVVRDRLHVEVNAFTSNAEGGITAYRWDWGDASAESNAVPTASHDYALAGLYEITLTVFNATGAADNATRRVSVAPSTLDYEFYDFFNVQYKEFWDYRTAVYGDRPINAECFNQTAVDNGICRPSNPDVPDVATYPYTNWYPLPGALSPEDPGNNPLIYAPYRWRATGVDVPGYNLSEPVFLPVLNYGQAPGSHLEFRWRMDYVNKTTATQLQAQGCPISPTQIEGFQSRSLITLTMDTQQSKRMFNVANNVTTPGDAQWWWDTNINPHCAGRGPVETAFQQWLVTLGGGSFAVGKYDIANSFEWYYQAYFTQMSATVDTATGLTMVNIDMLHWGTEVLLARWFYWGNASYSGSAALGFQDGGWRDSTKARGWWGMELAWFEEFDFSGSVAATSFDFTLRTAMHYHFQHLALKGPNGLYDRTDDIPYWSWGPILSDYTNDWSNAHKISELDRYNGPDGISGTEDDFRYVHSTPGGSNYGRNLLYEIAHVNWDLPAGQSWHFRFPTGNVIFYDPNLTPLPASPTSGKFITISKPLGYMATNPAGYGTWDAQAMTWDVLGPSGTGGPAGSPGNYALEPWGAILLGPGGPVTNQPPVASFRVEPSRPDVGQQVLFDGMSSHDPDGSIVRYAWGFGDGGSATGPTAVHVYRRAGFYNVNLTVTDNLGATTVARQLLQVVEVNQPPVARLFVEPTTVFTFEEVFADGRGSFDRDGFIVSYRIDWGDGSSTFEPAGRHQYRRSGTYPVTLNVTDDDGATSTDTLVVRVQNRPPLASFTFSPSSPQAGQPVLFDASASSDPDGTIVSYLWDFGDGIRGSGPRAGHTFAAGGTYIVNLTVVDDAGGAGGAFERIMVTARHLSVEVSGSFDYALRESVRVKVAALVVDARTGEPVSSASVTMEFYDDGGTLLLTAPMVERPAGSGIYQWQSSATIRELGLRKGVYLARVTVSHQGAQAQGMTLIHIDPPGEVSLWESPVLLSLTPLDLTLFALAAGGPGAATAVILRRVRRRRSP